MKISFLGTSHGITEKNQFCSSALVSTGGKHYLVDAGAPGDYCKDKFETVLAYDNMIWEL